MGYKVGVVRIAAPDRALPAFANWPFDYAWWFIPSGDREDLPGNYHDIHVKAFDQVAAKHIADTAAKTGQAITMPDGRTLEIPYDALDHEADLMMQRDMRPHPNRDPIDFVRCKDGTRLEKVPRDWFEQLVVSHVQRRQQEPPVTYHFGNGQTMTVSYLFHDAVCKDFFRRRDAMLSAGLWPELLIAENVVDPSKPGPMPVQGRPNAFGQGARVMTPAEIAQEMARQAGMPVAHPAENEGVV